MRNGLKISGLAVVLGLVGCLAEAEPSTVTETTQHGLTATSGAMQAPFSEEDDVRVAPGRRASDSSDDDATAARMPNNKHPDLMK